MTQSSDCHPEAQLDLMPLDAAGVATAATHTAIRSGAWFNPATWQGGQVPGTGALVHIPAGVAVDYDGFSNAKVFMIRVDGDLGFTSEDGRPTRLVVDTIITSSGSTFKVDADGPRDGRVSVVFAESVATGPAAAQYADTRAGDGVLGRSAWDPEQLSLGLVASGTVDIAGRPVLAEAKLATGPAAGATQIVLDTEGLATGWTRGQKIVVGAADWQGRDAGGDFQSRDEVRTIAAVQLVDGKTVVTLDRPLTYDHRGPAHPDTGVELTTHVGNLSRNVRFTSAAADRDGDGGVDRPVSVGDPVPPGGHLVTERGHIMFMHNDNVAVKHAAFLGLGRTDKSVDLDDYKLVNKENGLHRVHDDQGTKGVYDPGVDLAIKTDPALIENMRGRYAIHLHEAGIDQQDGLMAPCQATGVPVCACHLTSPDRDGDGKPDGALLQGNVVWGSPGWGIVQHDTRADLVDNVVFDVNGAAFVAETGNEVGTWSGNAAFLTYGVKPTLGNDDADDFNADFGAEGVGFWLEGRAIEVTDNVAISSARAGFMYRANGIGQLNVDTAELGALAAIRDGARDVAPEDVPIRVFVGNQVIGASEAIRIVTDPLDSVRKFSDAWSHLRDFTAYAIQDDGVSITYSSKYIFENFLMLGTGQVNGGAASTGFFFKASVADITILNSHVEGFEKAVQEWAQVGDRQEYRRGYWDPKSPAPDNTAPVYQGMGQEFGINNPAWNLWGISFVNLTHDNMGSKTVFTLPKITIGVTIDGVAQQVAFDTARVFNTKNMTVLDDPLPRQSVSIDLIDDSVRGGLVALWREDLANDPNQARVLANHIPLAYAEDVYLSQVYFNSGRFVKRTDYQDFDRNINADIWSGTVLEFMKTDSLGRQVFAYGDFAPTTPGEEVRAVTTNERILWSREQIDGVLVQDGYWRLPGQANVKFVVMETVFTDRLTGELTTRGFLVALDLAWQIPTGAEFKGIFRGAPGVIVAPEYDIFQNGVLVPGAAPIRPGIATPLSDPNDVQGDISSLGHAGLRVVQAAQGSTFLEMLGRTVLVDQLDSRNAPVNVLSGTREADQLLSTKGDDLMTGNRGADLFVFRVVSGHDRIKDFEIGIDDLSFRLKNVGFDDLSIFQNGADTVIVYGNNNTLTLMNTDASDLSLQDFRFM